MLVWFSPSVGGILFRVSRNITCPSRDRPYLILVGGLENAREYGRDALAYELLLLDACVRVCVLRGWFCHLGERKTLGLGRK